MADRDRVNSMLNGLGVSEPPVEKRGRGRPRSLEPKPPKPPGRGRGRPKGSTNAKNQGAKLQLLQEFIDIIGYKSMPSLDFGQPPLDFGQPPYTNVEPMETSIKQLPIFNSLGESMIVGPPSPSHGFDIGRQHSISSMGSVLQSIEKSTLLESYVREMVRASTAFTDQNKMIIQVRWVNPTLKYQECANDTENPVIPIELPLGATVNDLVQGIHRWSHGVLVVDQLTYPTGCMETGEMYDVPLVDQSNMLGIFGINRSSSNFISLKTKPISGDMSNFSVENVKMNSV